MSVRAIDAARLLEREYATDPEQATDREPTPPTLDDTALYGLAGDVVQIIEPHTEAHAAALLIQVLVAFGSVIGRNAYYFVEGARHYSNLFAVLVGDSSRGRKGTSWAHVLRLFETVAPDWAAGRIASGLSSGEGLIWHVRDPVEALEPVKEKGRVVDQQMVVIDAGVEDKRLLVQEGEFSMALRVSTRDGNTLTATIRNAWDTGDLSTLTKSINRAHGAHISIVGHITRGELLRYLDKTEAANGFGNRFLWVWVCRSKLLPDGGRMHEVDVAPLVRRLSAAVAFAEQAGQMHRDEQAGAMWNAVYGELTRDRGGLLGAVTTRAESQVVRLSCLYALLDESTTIRAEHMAAALALWEYCEDSARYIFGDVLGDRDADAILDALRTSPAGLTRDELRGLFSRHRSSEQIGRALAALEAAGKARRERKDTGGRPEERWYAT